jgi:4'-phosphopantetheinyl transferase
MTADDRTGPTGDAATSSNGGAGSWSVVEVWWARIDQARDEFVADLNDVERGRLTAYVRDADKARFLLGCTIVRRLLAGRFSLPAAKVRLDRTCPECGKPHGKVRSDGVELSVTHSGDLVGVAVGDRPVGLDVEQVDPGVDVDALAGIVLSPEEVQELSRYDGLDKSRAFTTYWTRKEAVVKANGDGLRTDLRTVIVSRPDKPANLLRWARHSGPIQLLDLQPDPGHAATLATLHPEPPHVQVHDATKLLS